MTTETDLLPLPEWTKRDDLGGLVPSEVRVEMCAYARANVAHATAPLQAEIEALRAEAEVWKASFEQAAAGHATYSERAEQLAEALECMIIGACAVAVPHNGERAVLQDAVNIARAALAAQNQEPNDVDQR